MSVTVEGRTYKVKTTYEGKMLVLQDADITSIKEIEEIWVRDCLIPFLRLFL